MRSTIQRLGKTTNPFARSERLTISTVEMRTDFGQRVGELRSLIAAIGEELFQKRKHPEQGRHDENAAIAILNVGRMHDGVQQQA